MNSEEARFMRIKRYSEAQVSGLHDVEFLAGNEWEIAGGQRMIALDREIGAYWEPTKTEEDRAREVEYFINIASVKKAFAKMRASTAGAMEAQHQADWDIWREAPMPNLSKGSGANRDRLAAIPGLYKPQGKPLPYDD